MIAFGTSRGTRFIVHEMWSDDELLLYCHIATSTNSTYIPKTYNQAQHCDTLARGSNGRMPWE